MVLFTIDRLKNLVKALLLVCMMLLQASCSRDERIDDGEGLQFVITPTYGTKVIYDDLHSAFENGDDIGCVIARKTSGGPVFVANTRWEFMNNVLMLQEEAASVIQRHSAQEKADEGYVELSDDDMSYLFYFYYPYIDNSVLDETYPSAGANYLVQTPSASNLESFPLFINLDQSSKAAINNSDFLWVGYTSDKKTSSDIRKSNATYPVNLEFSKKTAAIDVICDSELQDLRIKGRSESLTVSRGCMIDLTTGEMFPYPADGSVQYYNRQISSSHSGITPYEQDKQYRFILPAQENFGANLSFKINGTSYDADLTRLISLQSGKRYRIYIMSDDGSIVINDWEEDFVGDLVVQNPRVTVIDCPKYKPGHPIAMIGSNFDMVEAVRVPGAGDLTDFVVTMEGTRLEFILPDTIKDGVISLLSESGDEIRVKEFITIRPQVNSFSANPVNVNTTLKISGTDLDLVSYVIFGGNVEVPVTPTEEEIIVNVPINAVDGHLKFRLLNGEVAQVYYEELKISDSPLCRITELPEVEIKGGTVLTVPVVNQDSLTGVKVNGENVTYSLNGNMLSIDIPKTAGENSELTLVSTVDMVDYEVSYIIDCIADRFVEEVIWTGSYSPGQQIFDSSVCNWGGLDISAGRVILVFEFVPLSGSGALIVQNGWWQDLPGLTEIALSPGQTSYELEFTSAMINNLKGTSNSLLVRGYGYTLTKMTLKREI